MFTPRQTRRNSRKTQLVVLQLMTYVCCLTLLLGLTLGLTACSQPQDQGQAKNPVAQEGQTKGSDQEEAASQPANAADTDKAEAKSDEIPAAEAAASNQSNRYDFPPEKLKAYQNYGLWDLWGEDFKYDLSLHDSMEPITSENPAGYTYYFLLDDTVVLKDLPEADLEKTELEIPGQLDGHTISVLDCPMPEELTAITLPDTLKVIGEEVFEGRPLTEISLPRDLLCIADDAFYDCSDLAKLTFNDALITLGDSALANCYALEEVNLPASLQNIRKGALASLPITSITLPESVEVLGSEAFVSCNNLTEVNLNAGLKKIGSQAFSSCGMLEEIKLPDNLEEIGSDAFSESGLAGTITLPAACTRLHEGCFAYTALTEIDASAPLEFLGDNIMPEDCVFKDVNGQEHSLEDLYLDQEGSRYAVLNDQELGLLELDWYSFPMDSETYEFPSEVDGRKIVFIDCTIPSGAECKDFTIPEGVRIIDLAKAFDMLEEARTITLPSSLKRIEKDYLLSFDTYVSTLVVPADIAYINPDALARVQAINFGGSAEAWQALFPDRFLDKEMTFGK